MTDRYMGLSVVLDDDYRDDDAQSIISAILMIKGVAKVVPAVVGCNDYINRQRVALEIEERVFNALREDPAKAKK